MKYLWCAIALLLLIPATAHAHLVSTGFGTYYDGIAHLLVTPRDVLTVLAAGLLAGLRGPAVARWLLIAFPIAWLCGGLIGTWWPMWGELTILTTTCFLTLGVLIALDWNLPLPLVVSLVSIAGLFHGYSNGATMTTHADWLPLLGATSAVFVFATLLPAIVVSLQAAWMRIAVRVVGSWITAIGMLVIGWESR